MHGSRLNSLALLIILALAAAASPLFATSASGDCGGSVSKYGPCAYKGDLLFCGTCAFHESQSKIGVCNRCGPGYRCTKNSCAILNDRCGFEYSCDICGCSWGPATHP